MPTKNLHILLSGAVLAWVCAAPVPAAELHVGSKRFTESYILGELLAQTAAPHARVEHLQGLGNTAIVLGAVLAVLTLLVVRQARQAKAVTGNAAA